MHVLNNLHFKALLDLARGVTELMLTSPILPSKFDKGEVFLLPAGTWVEHGAMLTIKIELQFPILANVSKGQASLADGIYGRLVMVI
ncbi:hypothetical protein HK096_007391, partial [Nowakowskiella sp. JEL0078]